MKRSVYPGSFDPITLGHVDIIRRLNQLYDEVIVLVAHSHRKSYLFSADERADLARQCLQAFGNVRVEVFEGLTVEFAKRVKAQVIIRGLRAVSDFEYEMAMANMNKKLCEDIETLIVFARPELSAVSSRMVKEVAYNQGSLSGLVPEVVDVALKNKLGDK